MSLAAVLITVSLLWLSWRALQLWTLPLTTVLRHLQIEIPHAPRVTIDALAVDSVSLHWAPPESHVKKHIILANGQEVGVSTKGETSVRISGLTADHLYSIQIVAVNAQGFQMASVPTHVRTRPAAVSDVDAKQENRPHVQTFTTTIDSTSSTTKQPRKRNSLDTKQTDPSPTVAHAARPPDAQRRIDALTTRMETLNKETSDVDAQIDQLTDNHANEELLINKKLETLRLKKKEEDEAKSLKDQQHKQLDQQKREVESKRNQVQKALKVEQDALQKQTTDIASFRSSVQNSIETVEHLEESLKTLKVDTDDAIKDAERAAATATEELTEVESEIRYLLSRKSESEAELAKLQDAARVPEASAQEIYEEAQAEAAWKEREESLIKQYEEVQHNLARVQNNVYAAQDMRNMSSHMEHDVVRHNSMRRKVSRRGRAEEANPRSSPLPAFNPDAAPFVASATTFTNNDNNIHNRTLGPQFNTSQMEQYPLAHAFTQPSEAGFPISRSNFQSGPPAGASSIFSDEPTLLRSSSPFVRRGSTKSSQSGSNPPSPAIQNRSALPSIFNSAPTLPARNSSTSLVDRLNGTPLIEDSENSAVLTADNSKWFWPMKKKTASEALVLDRKNTRSLPKTDVAPIGTRRNRSGSLREETNHVRVSPAPVSNGYHDVDLLNAIGHPLSRETSVEKDGYSTTAVPLPRPSRGSAFGWEPQVSSSQRHLPNPWRDSDSHNNASAPKPFDPFGDLPTHKISDTQDMLQVPGKYHTTIDASRLASLDRAISNGSKKSSKSKAESQDSKDKMKRLGDTKFSSFVGRVFGKKDDKEGEDMVEPPADAIEAVDGRY